jgi:hypothetical protein
MRATLLYGPSAKSFGRAPAEFICSFGDLDRNAGQNIDEGIVRFGNSVEGSLRACDLRYLNSLRPPNEAVSFSRAV